MLYELFSWLYINHSDDCLFPVALLSLADLEQEKSNVLRVHRTLIADIHESRLKESDPDAIDVLHERMVFQEAYLDFLNILLNHCGEPKEKSTCSLALDYLRLRGNAASQFPMMQAKVKDVFGKYLEYDKENARIYYDKHHAAFPDVDIFIMLDKTNQYLGALIGDLEEQENLLGLVPLYKSFIDTSEQFAALIVLFIRRGIAVESILETGLLHEFIAYHSAWINTEESPVHALYTLLRCFPEVLPLVDAASKVECHLRGFFDDTVSAVGMDDDAHRSYALTGVQVPHRFLRTINIRMSEIHCTLTARNCAALYRLFGFQFITFAVDSYSKEVHPVLEVVLRAELKKPESFMQLVELINYYASNANQRHMDILLPLLEDSIFERMYLEKKGALLHVLAYKPFLMDKIKACDFSLFLEEIISNSSSTYFLVTQLRSLLQILDGKNQESAILVYERILDCLCHTTIIAEDDVLVRQLKGFSGYDSILMSRQKALEQRFAEAIQQCAETKPFSLSVYHYLEDVWNSVRREHAVYNLILEVKLKCPSNKYALQAWLANVLLQDVISDCDIATYVNILGIFPQSVSEPVHNEYEYFLIELVTLVGNPAVLSYVLAAFEECAEKKNTWFMPYEMLKKTVSAGNINFFSWLLSHAEITSAVLGQCIILAAQERQWNMVHYLLSLEELRPCLKNLRFVFYLAAEADYLPCIQELSSSKFNIIQNKKCIEFAMNRAIDAESDSVLHFLCSLEPDESKYIEMALKYALRHNKYSMVRMMIQEEKFYERIASILGEALVEKAGKDAVEYISLFCETTRYAIDPKKINLAFRKAIELHHWNVAEYFINQPYYSLEQEAIDLAFYFIIHTDCLDGTHLFNSSKGTMPTIYAIDRALLSSMKSQNNEVFKFLCTHIGIKPSQPAFNQALKWILKNSDSEKVKILTKEIDRTFLLDYLCVAIKQNHEDEIKLCLPLLAFSKAEIEMFMDLARLKNRKIILEYLEKVLYPKPKPIITSSRLLEPTETIKMHTPQCVKTTSKMRDVSSMRRVLSCSALNRFGFFTQTSGNVVESAPILNARL